MNVDQGGVGEGYGAIEKRLREKLGERCTPDILAAFAQAERQLVERKDNLVDLLEAGILSPTEFAQKVNASANVYLRFVADVIGPEACKEIYDFGPDEEVSLVDPRRVASPYRSLDETTIIRIVATELAIADNRVKTKISDEQLRAGLREVVRHAIVRGELADFFGGNRMMFLCWQTALVTSHLASVLEGTAVKDVLWRIAEKMLARDDWFLQPSRTAIKDFFNTVNQDLAIMNDLFANPEEGFDASNAANWLFEHAHRPRRWPIVEAFEKPNI